MKVFSTVHCSLSKCRKVIVGRTETSLTKEYDNRDIHGRIIMLAESPMNKIAKELLELKGVAYVEVIDMGGNGIRLEK